MPDEHVQAFLDAEERATQLVAALEALTAEAGTYHTAHQTLTSVGQEVGHLTARLSEVASDAKRTLEDLRRLGTPEILARVDSLSADAGRARAEVGAMVDALGQDLRGVATSVTEVGKSTLAADQYVRTALADLETRVRDRLDSTAVALSRLRLLAIVNVVLGLAVGALLLSK